MYHSLFIRLPIEGHLVCFQVSGIVNKTAVNIHVQVFVWTYIVTFLDKPQGVAESCAEMCYVL